MSSIWTEGLDLLRDKIPGTSFEAWISCLNPFDIGERIVVVEVPSNAMKEWVSDRYKTLLEESLSHVAGRPLSVRFQVSSNGPTDEPVTDAPTTDAPAPSDANPSLEREEVSRDEQPLDGLRLELVCNESNLDIRYGFDNFVVGTCNQFAHAAAHAVANRHVKGYNPYFIYGNVGLGKTHLINAIGSYVVSRKPTAKVRYVSSEIFTNELIDAIKNDRHEAFREAYRSLDVLLIDDIQLIAGKERTQEEFFYTFNTLYQAQKQIVVTSDRFPKDIKDLEDRLRSRFEWGLIADMQAPDLETRSAILKRKGEEEGLELPDSATLFLANNIRSNIRELEGSLNRVCAFSKVTNKPITVDLIRQVLRDNLRDTSRQLSIDEIQRAVARAFGVKVTELKSDTRERNITTARQVAMYLCRKLTASSFPYIGDQFGGRDHSTVIHAVRKIERKVTEDSAFQSRVDTLMADLEEAP